MVEGAESHAAYGEAFCMYHTVLCGSDVTAFQSGLVSEHWPSWTD